MGADGEAWLFDTNAISEGFRRRPNPPYVAWLSRIPRERQFTCMIVIGELFHAAFRSDSPERWLRRIAEDVLPSVTVLGFDLECARAYGQLRARLSRSGTPIGDADTQIAATALRHGLTVVTANVEHFRRVPDLRVRPFQPGAERPAGGG